MNRTIAWPLLSLGVSMLAGLALLSLPPFWSSTTSAPVPEHFERAPSADEPLMIAQTIRMGGGGIDLRIVASGDGPVRISQLQVDTAYWKYLQDPEGALNPGEEAWLRIPYPWVPGETHHVVIVLQDGTTLEHRILPTP